MLEAASTTLTIDDWLSWFADRALTEVVPVPKKITLRGA
ncbi:hypothetical protein FBZ99_10821 [Rhizobium sp. ERR 1071]|nr:hypothetical protein FBZ99_10821 [Rhizobium sp. ERR1071]